MKAMICKLQKITLIILFTLLNFGSLFAQVGSTKIKDGTVTTGPEKASPGALLELESANKGLLTPRLTTAQRDAIAASSLTEGLLIYNTTTGCFDYWSKSEVIWLSLCGTAPPAVFSISVMQCNSVKANGTYKQGETLTLSNYLSVPVTVTQPGTYTVSAITNNGYYFTANGNFPSAGSYVLNLLGVGTPNNGYDDGNPGDAVTISLNGKDSDCRPNIFVARSNVDFTIACESINSGGSYFIGIALTASDKLMLTVNVINIGFWNIKTNTVNGYSFSATGTFTTTGNQTIELLGTGVPIASGTNNFSLSSNAATAATASCSNIPVNIAPIAYTIDCATATQNGTFMQDVDLTGANTITLPINVTATGQTTMTTTTANGISFTSGLINLATLGQQTVTLTGSGKPVAGESTSLAVSGAPGMTGTCTLSISVAGQPVAYTASCSGITTAGSYAPGAEMVEGNTITVPVNVSYVGAYTMNTNTVNGISFSATGTFTETGVQSVKMTATGTPATGGVFTYAITTNSTNGALSCNVSIPFIFRTMNILGLGAGVYQPGTAGVAWSARAILASTANFGPTGKVQVQNMNIINGGYNTGATLKDLINTNNIDIIVMGYNYNTTDAATIAILTDFVKNKRGVFIQGQENGNVGLQTLINSICGSTVTNISTNGGTLINPLADIDDPTLNGVFGNIRGLAIGGDYNFSCYMSLPVNTISLATQLNNPALVSMFRHKTLGYVFNGDGGWIAGNATNNSTGIGPASITSTGLPIPKAYDGGTTVYNSIMYANTMAWAIQYVQTNTKVFYMIP